MMSLRRVRRKTRAAARSEDVFIDESSPTSSEEKETVQELEKKPEQTLRKNRKSKIWSYFELIVNNTYECVLCSRKVKHAGDSTSNFYRHLRNIHPSVSVPSFKHKELILKYNDKNDTLFTLDIDDPNSSRVLSIVEKEELKESTVEEEESPEEQQERLNEQQDKSYEHYDRSDEHQDRSDEHQDRSDEHQDRSDEHQDRSDEHQDRSDKHQDRSDEIQDRLDDHQETKSKKKKSSIIWKYFKLISKNKYQCTLCSLKIKYFGGTTANFHRHLRNKHMSIAFPSSRERPAKNVVLEFDEERENDVVSDKGEIQANEQATETAISKADDTSYDASQPWRFFNIQTGSATCRLCFQSLIYNSIAELTVLLNHLKSKHCISFCNNDSTDLQKIDIVDSGKDSCSSIRAWRKKLEMYYTNLDQTPVCEICSSSVSSNKKTLISHLYKKHRNFFSKQYPTFWHFSKFINSNSSKTASINSSNQISSDCDGNGFSSEDMNITAAHKRMSWSNDIVGNFMGVEGAKAKCAFCSKCFYFSGDISILEQHILNDHESFFIRKILHEMVFTSTSDKSTNKCSSEQQNDSLNKDLLSYYEPLENLQYKCKICSEIQILEDDGNYDLLAVHVWHAHMSKIFRSIVFLQSFVISGMKQKDGAIKCSGKLSKAQLESIKWVKPVGKLSKVWKYFLAANTNLPYAKCRLCNYVLSFKSANTGNLSRHINNKHNDVLRSDLNMFYENRRIFCRKTKRKIVKKFVEKELSKSFQCRHCFAHFSEWKFFCKHIRCSHKEYDFSKEIRFAKTFLSSRSCTRKASSSSVKCKLCGEYLPHGEASGKHLAEKHTQAYNTGVTYEKYKDCVTNEFSMKRTFHELQNDSCVDTFFVRSGSSFAKCQLCKKFISKNRHCRHRVQLIYSLSFGVKTFGKSKLAAGKKSSRIYCSSMNIIKNFCDICLKTPMSSICRCIVNRRFVPPAISQNDVSSTVYLQDISESERQVYAVLFSINYFEKSCCLLCSERISQASKFRSCFDHFRLKHGTLVTNFNKMYKTAEIRRLIDNIEYQTYFESLLNLMNDTEQRAIEEKTSSVQPSLILKSVDHDIGHAAIESENTGLSNKIGDSTSNFDFVCENVPTSLNISSENPTTSFGYNDENPSSNMFIISDIQTLDSIENATLSIQAVDVETHSSVLAITSQNQAAEQVEVTPQSVERQCGVKRRKSILWRFFTRLDPDNASCNSCSRVFKNSTLNNLSRHLKNKHPKLAELLKRERIEEKLSVNDTDTNSGIVDKWVHFRKLSDDWAECNKCKRYISMRGGSTNNLLRHMKSRNCTNRESEVYQLNEVSSHLSNNSTGEKSISYELELTKKEPRRNASNIWQYFEKVSPHKAMCNMCQHVISIKNNNLSNLSRHLRTVHLLYIIPSPTLSLEASAPQATVDNSMHIKPEQYKYVVDEHFNISQVTNNESPIINEGGEHGQSFLLEETFPSYIAEEVVDLNTVQKNNPIDDEAIETISLDTLLSKIYRSPSWKYFTKLANSRVKCNLCEKTLAFKSSKCINNLTRHLKKKHASVMAETATQSETNNEKFVVFAHDARNETEPPAKKIRKERTSVIWNYFTLSEHLKIVTCNICEVDLSYKSCPISNLRRHLEVKHADVFKNNAK